MANKIILRRDTATNWSNVDPVLSNGEIGLETSTGRFKIGNGTAAWSALPYFADAAYISGQYASQLTSSVASCAASAATSTTNAASAAASATAAAASASSVPTTTNAAILSVITNLSMTSRQYLDDIYGADAPLYVQNHEFDLGQNNFYGTRAQFNTALTDGNFATQAGTETLTNKTLSSVVSNGGSFSGPTITSPAIAGVVTLDGTAVFDGDFEVDGSISVNGAGGVQWFRKSITQAVTSTSVWANDTELSFNAVSGRSYLVKYGVGIATSNVGLFGRLSFSGSGTATRDALPLTSNLFNLVASGGIVQGVTREVLVTATGGAQSVVLQYVTDGAGTTNVTTNSWMRVERID